MLAKWLKQLFGRQEKTSQARITPELAMRFILSVEERDGLGCEDCYILFDQYADRVLAGEDPAEWLPEVEHHIEGCRYCREELNALITVARHSA